MDEIERKTCACCGKDISQKNWVEFKFVIHSLSNGSDDVYYICPRCYTRKIKKLVIKED